MVTDHSNFPVVTARPNPTRQQYSQPLLWHKRDPEANPRYKTQLCSHFMGSGHCPFGDSCVYAHGEHERRELTPHALAMRAQRQRQRAAEQRAAEQVTAEQPPLTLATRGALVSPDKVRPSVCSPVSSSPDSNSAALFWTSARGAEDIWSPPKDNSWPARSHTAEGTPNADTVGDDSSCGIDLARMTSALLSSDSDDKSARVHRPEQLEAKLEAKLKQLECITHLYGANMLTQSELSEKMVALLDTASAAQKEQLRSLAHLFASGIFSLDELTAKVSAVVEPASASPASPGIGDPDSDPIVEVPDEPSAPGSSGWSTKSDVFSGSDDEIKFGDDESSPSQCLSEAGQFDLATSWFEAQDAGQQLATLLATKPALAGMVRHGRTLLMLAAKKGRQSCVRELGALMEPAQMDRRTKEKDLAIGAKAAKSGGYTALHYAAFYGHRAAVEALLEVGADPTVQNAAGETPARTAGNKSHGEIASILKAAAGKAKRERRSTKQKAAANSNANNSANGRLALGPAGPGCQSYRSSKWSGSSDLGSDFARARGQLAPARELMGAA